MQAEISYPARIVVSGLAATSVALSMTAPRRAESGRIAMIFMAPPGEFGLPRKEDSDADV